MQRDKTMSIRLSPDGLSFWTGSSQTPAVTGQRFIIRSAGTGHHAVRFEQGATPAQNIAAAYKHLKWKTGAEIPQVLLFIDTLQTVYIPEEFGTEGTASAILGRNNYFPARGQTVFETAVLNGVKACGLFEAELLHEAFEVFRPAMVLSCAHYNLAREHKGFKKRDRIDVFTTPGNVYTTVTDRSGKLLHCDVANCTVPAEMVFYLTKLKSLLGLENEKLYLAGTGAAEIKRVLDPYFKVKLCE